MSANGVANPKNICFALFLQQAFLLATKSPRPTGFEVSTTRFRSVRAPTTTQEREPVPEHATKNHFRPSRNLPRQTAA